MPGWVFIDWAEVDRRGQCTALNALYCHTLGDAARVARWPGAGPGPPLRGAGRPRPPRASTGRLWDEGEASTSTPASRGVQDRRVSQQTNALLDRPRNRAQRRWPRILAAITDEARLRVTSTGAGDLVVRDFDEERQVVLAQPFFMHHLHRALAERRRSPRPAVDNLRRRWGAMLDAGATTFWEHWHGGRASATPGPPPPPSTCRQRCWAWRRWRPGSAGSRWRRSPAGLGWASGVFPSARGDIIVAWEPARRRSGWTVEVPPETTARVVVPPPDEGQWRAIQVNGDLVWQDGAIHPNAVGVTAARVDPDGVHLDIDRHGQLTIEARLDRPA